MAIYRHPQVRCDLTGLLKQDLPWHEFKNKTVLITGAAGMLASYIGFTLLFLNEKFKLNIRPIFLARNKNSLINIYGAALNNAHCIIQDICDPISFQGKIDYIIHAAGSASPYYILNDPIGIINANVQGTAQVLKLALKNETKNIVFTSTREIYGQVKGKEILYENDMGTVDPLHPRECYSESKRLAEALLMAYHTQYHVNFNTIRLAHTYGPGMTIENDGRVMSDLISDVVKARDIHLKSSGEAERAFCYVTDAVSGVIRVMLHGEPCQAYNLSNENEPISILSLANLLQELAGNNKGVRVSLNGNQAGYTAYARTPLSTRRLSKLGWRAEIELRDGLKRTLNVYGEN